MGVGVGAVGPRQTLGLRHRIRRTVVRAGARRHRRVGAVGAEVPLGAAGARNVRAGGAKGRDVLAAGAGPAGGAAGGVGGGGEAGPCNAGGAHRVGRCGA